MEIQELMDKNSKGLDDYSLRIELRAQYYELRGHVSLDKELTETVKNLYKSNDLGNWIIAIEILKFNLKH